MDKLTVLKPFRTPTRRFAAGQQVTPGEVDGPVSVDDWLARGFLGAPVASPVAAPPAVRRGGRATA